MYCITMQANIYKSSHNLQKGFHTVEGKNSGK